MSPSSRFVRVAPVSIAIAVMSSAAFGQGLLTRHYGDNLGDQLGSAVANAGDINGDGIDDLVVGAPEEQSAGASTGMIKVYSGADGSVLTQFYGSISFAEFGAAVDGVGDVDLDGFADFLVASPGDGGSVGSITVFSGGTNLVLQTLTTGPGYGQFPALGRSAAGIGDIDNDGITDVVGGAPAASVGGTYNGAVLAFSGATGAILFTFAGNPAGAAFGEQFGYSTAGVGDINGDGRPDFAGGSVLANSAKGYVKVYSGATGQTLYTFNGDSANDWFGYSIDGAGDVNGDGRGDIVVGAPLDDNTGTNSGSIRVLSGLNGGILYTRNAIAAGDQLGTRVAGLGDVDGDGKSDVIGGAPLGDSVAINAGYARIYGGATGVTLTTINGLAKDDNFGGAVNSAGDANGDGKVDVVIGAPLAEPTGSQDNGSASVYSLACGAIAAYGTACPGSGGFAPSLSLSGCATPGGTLDFSIANANGAGGAAVVLVSVVQGSGPLGGGCTLLIGPALLAVTLPLLGVGPGAGGIQFPVTLPIPSALGTIKMQAFCQDPALFIGFTATNGVSLTIS